MNKIGRNDACPCGSGKKNKLCCGRAGVAGAAKAGASALNVALAIQEAVQHHQAGRLVQAEAIYRQILGVDPRHVDSLHLLGVIYQGQGRLDEAIANYRRAIDLKPNHAEFHSNLGNALQMQGESAKAAEHCKKAVTLKPDYAEAYCNLGNALGALGQADAAIENYRRAVLLKPAFAMAHRNLGVAFHARGQLDEAIDSHRRALSINPDYAEVHSNLGATLEAMGRPDEAIACYRQALAVQPNYANAHFNLGNALRAQGCLGEAIASYRDAILFDPRHFPAYDNLLYALMTSGRMDEAMVAYRKVCQIRPEFIETYSNLLFCQLHQESATADACRIEQLRFAERFERPLQSGWRTHGNDRDPARRLRVGFVSADLRKHPVADFIEPVWAALSTEAIEIWAYANHQSDDEVTMRLRGLVAQWRSIFGISDTDLAEQIRADGIDILIDLSGHSAGNRLLTFAHKPAPVQIIYLGYPGSSGLQAMDYRLTDHCADPESNAVWYREKLLYMPDSLWCYKPKEAMPEPGPLPALTNGFLTFGSLNNLSKVNEATLDLWAELLKSLPDARLLLATVPEGGVRRHLLQKFASRGIPAARLDLVGRLASSEFYHLFHRVDIALDPITMNGATTTCEGLWMGVPTLNLVGQRFGARAGLSLLTAAGMPEFAVSSQDAYLALAQHYAGHLAELAQLRATLRNKIASSPLTDAARFAQNMEAILRQCWQAWLSDQPL